MAPRTTPRSRSKASKKSPYFSPPAVTSSEEENVLDSDQEESSPVLRKSRRSTRYSKRFNEDLSGDELKKSAEKPVPKRSTKKKAKKDEDENFEIEVEQPQSSKARKRKTPVKKTPKKAPASKKSKKQTETVLDENNNLPEASASNDASDSDSDDDEDGWVDCEMNEVVDLENYEPEIPQVVSINLENKNKKKRQPGDWINPWIQQQINKMRKAAHLDAHKVHLLIFIGRLQYLNNIANDETVRGLALSVLPEKLTSSKNLGKILEKFEDWFFEHFSVKILAKNLDKEFTKDDVLEAFDSQNIQSQVTLNVLLLTCLRILGLTARLVYYLNPIPVICPYLLNRNTAKAKAKEAKESSKKSSKKSNKTTSKTGESSQVLKTVNPSAIRYWIEIFDATKKTWIVFESEHNHVRKTEIPNELPDEIRYILAIDNENFVSEVTARYAEDFFSHQMRRRRINDTKWWDETLALLSRKEKTPLEEADDTEFQELLLTAELPNKMADFKNHQLFVLEKDVLKYQGIYPRDSKVLGMFKNHKVFPRSSVHTLRSRETWLRQARSVKMFEIPYKVTTSSFRTNPNTGKKEDLELFGEWQTKPYDPPVAKNGVVPRNAYGNVELFQACMLPVGTVHLKLPGLLRIAGKLNIDCAAAVTGFDTVKGGGRGSHPVTEGFVVCEEYEKILTEAWEEEQVNIARRAEERRLKRIYGNWKRLIKGLFIREKLASRFQSE